MEYVIDPKVITFSVAHVSGETGYNAHFSQDVSSNGYVLFEAPWGYGATPMLAIADLCTRVEAGEFEWGWERH